MFIPSIKRGFRTLNVASAILPSGFKSAVPTPENDGSYGDQPFMRFLSLGKSAIFEFLDIPSSAAFNTRPYLTLLLNLITQLFCVSGVNQMTSVRLPSARR